MKLISIITKSFKEQIRSYRTLLLSLLMGPFFIFIYFLITESSKPGYKILIVNNDTGFLSKEQPLNHGKELITYFRQSASDSTKIPLSIEEIPDRATGIEKIKNKDADALIVISKTFSQAIYNRTTNDSTSLPGIEFAGDLTNNNCLVSAVYANDIINEYTLAATRIKKIVDIKETALGSSANVNSFDFYVPGLLIVSLIMLMFTAGIAFVSEVENKTIIRLKLSRISAFDFVAGVGVVQLLFGIIFVLLSLLTAVALGFHYTGSILTMALIAGLTTLSIISFGLIIAGLTKSTNEVLVAGNFPVFLFMFFSGAAFPLKSEALFSIAGYPVNIQSLMTPTHAISALNKTFIMNMPLSGIIPEIVSIILLTILYFIIAALIYRQRHLKLT